MGDCEKYDFESTNGTDKVVSTKPNYYYRGMTVGTAEDGLAVYTSAREIGNFVAGFVAGANNMLVKMHDKHLIFIRSQKLVKNKKVCQHK